MLCISCVATTLLGLGRLRSRANIFCEGGLSNCDHVLSQTSRKGTECDDFRAHHTILTVATQEYHTSTRLVGMRMTHTVVILLRTLQKLAWGFPPAQTCLLRCAQRVNRNHILYIECTPLDPTASHNPSLSILVIAILIIGFLSAGSS